MLKVVSYLAVAVVTVLALSVLVSFYMSDIYAPDGFLAVAALALLALAYLPSGRHAAALSLALAGAAAWGMDVVLLPMQSFRVNPTPYPAYVRAIAAFLPMAVAVAVLGLLTVVRRVFKARRGSSTPVH